MPTIVCVPNVSEGRREDVIHHLSESIESTRGVRLLNVASDKEQNRTVFTFLGRPTALTNAVYRMTDAAIDHIDLRKHKGKHPRMGIIDVVPFVPVRDITMSKAVKIANSVGRGIAERFNIPVYMYGEAAKSDERFGINRIRQGEFEGFNEKIKEPEWKPDYGPSKVHPTAGVTGVGARWPLVAFNVILKTDRREIAEKIAHSLRFEQFNPEVLKALVFRSNGKIRFKIAVTILNSKKIPLYKAVEAVKEEAAKHKTEFIGTELVGLVTGEALFDCLENYLDLVGFDPLQIIDFHLPKKKT